MQTVMQDLHEAAEVQWQLTCVRFEEWAQNEVFHFKWWLLIALYILCAYIWWKTADKSRLKEIILYTSLIIIVILLLDELGEELTLWDYPVDIFPLFPPISAVDFSCLPLVYSLIYQRFRPWRSFVAVSLVMAVVFCFVCEPIFVYLGIYQTLTWKFYYGLPIYFAMAVCTKAMVALLYQIAGKAGSSHSSGAVNGK
jgi:hypothetical protein